MLNSKKIMVNTILSFNRRGGGLVSGLENVSTWRGNRLTRSLALLLVGLISVFTLSCTPQTNEDLPLRIGTNIWPGYEPLYLARELGYLNEQEVRMVEFSSASQVMRAYRNGLIDAAALTLDEAILLLSQGYNPRILLVMDVSAGADAIVARPDIKNIAELFDKKIAVENSALGAFVLGRALELNGMTVDQIEVLPLAIDKQFRAFAQGQVDAAVTFEPVKTALLRRGAHVLFDSTQIPGEIVDVLVVREQFFNRNPSITSSIQDVWYRALDYFSAHPNKAADIMSRRIGLSPEQTLASYDGLILPTKQQNEQLLSYQQGSDPELLKAATHLYSSMLQQGMTPGPVEVKTLFPQQHHSLEQRK
jgi:NitT/TauT family transport system substrate-binding protein